MSSMNTQIELTGEVPSHNACLLEELQDGDSFWFKHKGKMVVGILLPFSKEEIDSSYHRRVLAFAPVGKNSKRKKLIAFQDGEDLPTDTIVVRCKSMKIDVSI